MTFYSLCVCLQIDWGFDDDTDAAGTDDVIDFDIDVEDCGIVLEENDSDLVVVEDSNGFEIVDVSAEDTHEWRVEEVGSFRFTVII